MDADRVRSYLQVACAGLGFDIGEVWWMSNENGTSTVAAIGKFLHPYTFFTRYTFFFAMMQPYVDYINSPHASLCVFRL